MSRAMRHMLIGAMLLPVAAGCAQNGQGSASHTDSGISPQPAPAGQYDHVVITLERTPCLGGCPVYSLTISDTGTVTFVGKANVKQLGTATGRIGELQLKELVEEFDRAGYFSLADRYAYGEATCTRYAADAPSVITSITLSGRMKRIEHDHGCQGAPEQLTHLEARIDEIAGSARWTGR